MHVLHEWTSLQPPRALHTDTSHWGQAGTLGQALQRGLFHTRRSRRPRLLPLLAIALDVAEALAYLHDAVIGLVRRAGCGVALSAMLPVVFRLCWGFLGSAGCPCLCHAPGCQAQLVVV
jgi:hypothetical protein